MNNGISCGFLDLLKHLIGISNLSCKKGKLPGKSVDCDLYNISIQPRFYTEQLEKLCQVDNSSQVSAVSYA